MQSFLHTLLHLISRSQELLPDTARDWAGFVLAVTAIAFAVRQFFDARRHRTRIELLAKSMSTQFVGLFPKNIADITELVDRANTTLEIMVDYVGYGHYSSPKQFDRYLDGLKAARERGVSTRMVVYNNETALNQSQFAQFKENEFDAEQKSDRFKKFFSLHEGHLKSETWSDFNKLICDFEQRFQEELLDRGVAVKLAPQPLFLFFWIQDGQEAVFAFLNRGQEYRELAFRTRDAKLVETFHNLFEQTWNSIPSLLKLAGVNQITQAPLVTRVTPAMLHEPFGTSGGSGMRADGESPPK